MSQRSVTFTCLTRSTESGALVELLAISNPCHQSLQQQRSEARWGLGSLPRKRWLSNGMRSCSPESALHLRMLRPFL